MKNDDARVDNLDETWGPASECNGAFAQKLIRECASAVGVAELVESCRCYLLTVALPEN